MNDDEVSAMVNDLNARLNEEASQIVAVVNDRPVTRAELRIAFRLVENLDHWKNPISKVVDLNDDEKALVAEAITFYTGSVASFHLVGIERANRRRYHVKAAGDYAAIGA
jgi:hypothetical protein